LRIPNRPAEPLFKGRQGKQKPELQFDSSTGTVGLKVLVQDSNGYFIPDIRRDNFAVYENGVRQHNLNVEVERAPASVALLMEYGGRLPGVSRDVAAEALRAGYHLLEALGKDDKLAAYIYSDKVQKVADFSTDHEIMETRLFGLDPPQLSETNLYDAVITTNAQIKPLPGYKAMVLLSSGVDTFSKVSLEDVLQIVEKSPTPVYSVSLVPAMRADLNVMGGTNSAARLDWSKADSNLQTLSVASGGREYIPDPTMDLSAIYDDLLENLKVRYVITYKSSSSGSLDFPRKVRVVLIDPATGSPLRIIDANGNPIHAKVIVQDSYTPGSDSTR
jgi:Ca-activated chloride channel family protein